MPVHSGSYVLQVKDSQIMWRMKGKLCRSRTKINETKNSGHFRLLISFFQQHRGPIRGYRDTGYLGKNYRDTGYLGEKLTGYGIFKKIDSGISNNKVAFFKRIK